MTGQITINRRFNGPPKSGHGGYVCGIIADFIGPCAEITLRSPPPLDRPLTVERTESGEVRLSDAESPLQRDGKRSCASISRIHPPLKKQKALPRDIQALQHTPFRPVSDAATSGLRAMDYVFSLVR